MQDSGGGLRREARGRYGELKCAGSDVSKGELPVVAGDYFQGRGLIFLRLSLSLGLTLMRLIFMSKFDSGAGDDSSALIDDGSADAAGCLVIRELLAG